MNTPPPDTIHGTVVASPGTPARGLLLLGSPGAGKSDLALRLIDRGWQLVADDRVALAADAAGRLWAAAPAALAGQMEVRGIGIIDTGRAAAVPLALVLDLDAAPERLPDPQGWQAPGHQHHPLPRLGFAPFAASAAIAAERALRLHGLAPDNGAMSESPPDTAPAPAPAERLPMLVVSGMSGAGKSTTLKALEDMGYEVVDNLPLALAEALIAGSNSGPETRPLAFGIDIRTRAFAAEPLVDRLRALKHAGTDIRLLYLDCADDALVRRFSETRRRHPLAQDRPAVDGITRERNLTAPLRRWADLVIDTSDLSAADLRRRIAARLGVSADGRLTITVQSFGFANGLPRNADLVFDMRFLSNPHWEPALRPLTGEDAAVAAHVEADPAYAPAVDRIADLLTTLLPGYGREGKAYLTIAIGCTGGRHRSVAVARAITARLEAAGHPAVLEHRDLDRAASEAATPPAAPLVAGAG